jgi:putative membrane protein
MEILKKTALLWGWQPMWGFSGMFMMIIMFLFWAARFAGVILDRGETALDILKKRFARGEIDRQKFEEKKKLLE